MTDLLEISNISKAYPGVQALEDVSFNIKKGEVHALVGENGAGKSTLIKILAGVKDADSGTIKMNGEICEFSHALDALRSGIAVTYQDLSLFDNLTVAENIAISRKLEEGKVTYDWSDIREIARTAVQKLGIEVDINQELGFLTVGQQQLIAIARAIAHDAEVVILDEPTASLAREDVDSLFKIINILRENNISILFISHKLDEIYEVSDRISVLRNGKYMGTYQAQDISESELIKKMVGREVRFNEYSSRQFDDELLAVNKLSKKGYFADISLNLNKGEILGITGLVGAGRSELAQALFGVNIPDSGEIIIEGKKVKINSTADALKAGIAYVPEDRHGEGLILNQTLSDNIISGVLNKVINKFHIIQDNKKEKLTSKWIKELDISPPYPEMAAEQFSGGNQQKAVIAKWLAYEPKILIVDEPTHGIDVGAKNEIHKLLRELTEQGIGVIVISSEFPEVMAISDRILVMRRGRIVKEFKDLNITQEEILNEAITN